RGTYLPGARSRTALCVWCGARASYPPECGLALLTVMRWLLHTTLLGVAFTACQSAGPPVTHVEEAPTVTIDEEGLLDVLDTLGTIAYDHPERFIHHPDSFINLLPRQPTSPEGKELYAWLLLNIGYALREHGRIRESI